MKKVSSAADRCRRKFLRFFPGGFRDETYRDWERDYKWETHERWEEALGRGEFERLLKERAFGEVAARAVRVEQKSRHSMIFSFEKMALRDAVKVPVGAKAFAEGLYDFLHGSGDIERRFERWCEVVGGLPRRQTRVPHVATRDGIRLHCRAGSSHLPQTDGDADRRAGIWLRIPLQIAAVVGDVLEPARVRRDGPA
jgi:hypothetical protein